MKTPQLTFACELETGALQALFADPAILPGLEQLGAGIALGLLDFSEGRAAVVQELNRAGIPLVAWLLLPREQGYWFNAANLPQARDCYSQFAAWTAQYNLHWSGIGVDIEPDFDEMRQLASGNLDPLRPLFFRRLFQGERIRRAQVEYAALIARMQAGGYRVDSYQLPFIADERRAGSTLLQRLFGLVDILPDREVLMLYTSFLRSLGPGVLWSYADDAGLIGVGSAGGGVEIEGEPTPLTWDELSRDLLLANRWERPEIFIFSLEGCARQGFLAKLIAFDWGQPVTPPIQQAQKVDSFRRLFRGLLWASAHPLTVLLALAGLGWLVRRLWRRQKDE